MPDEQNEPDKIEYVDFSVGTRLNSFFGHDVDGKQVPPENFDESKYYFEVIEPKLLELRQLCEDRRLPFVGLVIHNRADDVENPERYHEGFIMASTDVVDLRTGVLQRGIFAVVMDTNAWTIGPTHLLAANVAISEFLGGLADDSTNEPPEAP